MSNLPTLEEVKAAYKAKGLKPRAVVFSPAKNALKGDNKCCALGALSIVNEFFYNQTARRLGIPFTFAYGFDIGMLNTPYSSNPENSEKENEAMLRGYEIGQALRNWDPES